MKKNEGCCGHLLPINFELSDNMNICTCIVGDSSFPPLAGVSVFTYDAQTAHSTVVKDAVERGYTAVIVIDGAIFDPRKLFMLPAILHHVRDQCVFLGGEQYGPLLPVHSHPLFSMKRCTITHCDHAYILRYSGMRKMMNQKTIKPTLLTWRSYDSVAIVPAIASARSCPNWITRLPKIPMILPKFEDHCKFQAFLETEWQSFLRSIIGYILFSMVSETIKRSIVANCT